MRLFVFCWFTFIFAMGICTNASAQSVVVDRVSDAYWEGEGWRVIPYPEEQMCDLAIDSVTNESFTLGYYPLESQFSLVFTNKEAKSLKSGQKISLWLVFITNGKVDAEWGEFEFTVTKNDENVFFGTHGFNKKLLNDVSQSDIVGLFRLDAERDPVVVSAVPLKGSAKAIVQLKECAFEAAGLNPNDPFLQ